MGWMGLKCGNEQNKKTYENILSVFIGFDMSFVEKTQ